MNADLVVASSEATFLVCRCMPVRVELSSPVRNWRGLAETGAEAVRLGRKVVRKRMGLGLRRAEPVIAVQKRTSLVQKRFRFGAV